MSKSSFDSPVWHRAVAEMLASDSAGHIADNLIAAVGEAVDHNGTCLLAFHADAPPEVLHHTLEPEGERHYVERYLAGPYLLDPLYELALDGDKPPMCRSDGRSRYTTRPPVPWSRRLTSLAAS